jgi:hypothetical protein
MNIKRFFLPTNLPIAEMRQKSRRPEYLEKMFFLISTIHFFRVIDKTLKKDSFIQLKATFLGKLIGRNFIAKVKGDLIGMGIIETDGQWIIGEKSIGYRLTAAYRNEKIFVLAARFAKVVEYRNSMLCGAPKEENMDESELYIWDTLQRITIDEEALADIERTYNAEIEELRERSKVTKSKKELQRIERARIEAVNSHNFSVISYGMIKDGNLFWAKDRFAGRIFNNAANCPKGMRAHFRLDGRLLAECDISNCQPTLMYWLYKDKDSAEARRYKAIVESGAFYEAIMDEAGLDRDETKLKFMSFAFGDPRHENKVSRAFKALFPELLAVINKEKQGGFSAFPIKLQKVEADLMIQTVVPLCKTKGIPILTVHDSAMTFPEFASEVAGMIQRECERLYGVVPNVSQKAEAASSLALAA